MHELARYRDIRQHYTSTFYIYRHLPMIGMNVLDIEILAYNIHELSRYIDTYP